MCLSIIIRNYFHLVKLNYFGQAHGRFLRVGLGEWTSIRKIFGYFYFAIGFKNFFWQTKLTVILSY